MASGCASPVGGCASSVGSSASSAQLISQGVYEKFLIQKLGIDQAFVDEWISNKNLGNFSLSRAYKAYTQIKSAKSAAKAVTDWEPYQKPGKDDISNIFIKPSQLNTYRLAFEGVERFPAMMEYLEGNLPENDSELRGKLKDIWGKFKERYTLADMQVWIKSPNKSLIAPKKSATTLKP